jgi:ectoine hydroxylase-related dioxygenase (phytanoyl-CoA dioxygenase family)
MQNLTDADVATHLTQIDSQGFSIIPDVLDPSAVRDLLDRVDHLADQLGIQPGTNGFEGERTLRIYNLLVHGKLFEALPIHSKILPIVEGVLDDGCLLSTLSSIDIQPGESAQPIHADDQVIGLPKPHPAVVCNTMFALTDFTEANGATRVIPGSHLEPSPEFGRHYDSIPAEMAAGSVLVWHGSLWHGGGTNATDERRVGLAVNFCAGFIRQQENQQLGIPRSIAAGFDTRLARLCGYGTYRGLIGHIDKTDPLTLLDPSGTHAMLWDRT